MSEQNKYYWTDLTLPIVQINAASKDEAEKVIQQFIDTIAPIMDDKIRWDNADWNIKEDVLDEEKGEWITNE